MKTLSEILVTRSSPELKREVDEASNGTGRFNLDKIAKKKMSEDLETWAPHEPTTSLRYLDRRQTKPLTVDVALLGLTTPTSASGS